ncbi:MAG: hypothetical protein ACRDBO_16195 [Lachnospiraceae bacterium]
MDPKFQSFIAWYESQISVWEQNEIFVDRVYESEYAQQYHIEVHSQNGLGRVSLYESNNMYWVDFEAGSMSSDEWFFRVNITYGEPEDIKKQNQEFIDYMSL